MMMFNTIMGCVGCFIIVFMLEMIVVLTVGAFVQFTTQAIVIHCINKATKSLANKGYSDTQIHEIYEECWNKIGRCTIFFWCGWDF